MTKRFLLVTATVLATLVSLASPASAADAPAVPEFAETACPQLTDSIHRLYTAYFLRAPEQNGFEYWESEYSGGRRNLDDISGFFAVSPEFQAIYGSLDDGAFVDLVYRNVMDRQPDAAGRQYWLNELAAGLSRGTMMIFFSESEEYVGRTATAPPLAGYLRWYPAGVRFACGWGDATFTPHSAANLFDLLVHNGAASASFATVLVDPVGSTPMGAAHTAELDTGERLLLASHPFVVGDAAFGSLAVDVAADAYWAFVEFPPAIPSERPGW